MEQQPAGGALSLSLRKLSLFLERQPLLRSSSSRSAQQQPQRRQLLDSVSGDVPPGALACVLGGSGSGKTSLLNTLALRLPEVGYSTTGACASGASAHGVVLAPQSRGAREGRSARALVVPRGVEGAGFRVAHVHRSPSAGRNCAGGNVWSGGAQVPNTPEASVSCLCTRLTHAQPTNRGSLLAPH